ncbi:MAG: aldose epimerase [Myxococcaceae bacterium]|nr:aldose epimerase [Myxococcaceae bacterium]
MSIERLAGPGPFTSYLLRDDQAEVQVVPERGGLVTRWCVRGDEVLHLDEATLLDRTKNVRGGIPLLFPNAGPLPEGRAMAVGRTVTQPQHGLARLHPWEVVDAITDGDTDRLVMRLSSTEETRAGFPFEFASTLAVSLYEGRLLLEWRFENTGDVGLPLHVGLHPYFRVPVELLARARVPTRATRLKERRSGLVREASPLTFGTEEVDVALLDHDGAAAVLERGDGARVELSWTPQLSTLVVWSLPGQPFVCVEPWTAPAGALASGDGLLTVAPGQSEAMAVELRFTPG